MFVYSVIMFSTAVLFAVLCVLIYRGNTNLIHSYHQEKVTDKTGYGRAFGKAMSPIAIASLVSGVIPFFDKSDTAILISVGILVAGIALSLVLILRVQKRYNDGLF